MVGDPEAEPRLSLPTPESDRRVLRRLRCLRHRLAVELDGEQHFESEYDDVRDARLRAGGSTVLRFWNNEVLVDLDTVLDTIAAHCRMMSWE